MNSMHVKSQIASLAEPDEPFESERLDSEFPSAIRNTDDVLEQHIRDILRLLGEEPEREGLEETPRRFREAWREWTQGYRVDTSTLLKTFDIDPSHGEELILVRDIPVYSHCEHHLTPFFGTAHVGYLPNGRIVGLSKLPRLVNVFARRLQVQERLTGEVADALENSLQPRGVGVILQCRHLCMESRGVRSQGAVTTTSVFRGILKNDVNARSEFLARTR